MIVAHLALGSALVRDGDNDGAARAFASAERLLAAMDSPAIVPSSDGEPAGRLLEMARLQSNLARRGDAA